VAVQHREDYNLLASKGDKGGALELTGHSNRPWTQRGRIRGGGTNGAGESQIGGNLKKVERRRGEGKRRGRWCVPALGGADGGESEARASPARPIYRPAKSVPGGKIFLVAALIHHARSWLTLSGRFATVAACP
jgi:hypothetical protein